MIRTLGRSGVPVTALGIGTWAVGGPTRSGTRELGWGPVDDDESIRALRAAADLGVTFVDTADTYGAGHAERIVGRALAHRRGTMVWATKWGNTYDEATRQKTGFDPRPDYARRALQASLRRLGTDWVDLWFLHVHDLPMALAEDLVAVCEDLVAEGSIRMYGWSTDDPARAELFARGPNCCAVEHQLNVLQDDPEMLATCDAHDLASVDRGPLAMGLLTDEVTSRTRIPAGDLRHDPPPWLHWFTAGRPDPVHLARRELVRDILESDGRTLAQGALAWIWARHGRTVPIPGCHTVAQVTENAGALGHGPLTPDQFAAVEAALRP